VSKLEAVSLINAAQTAMGCDNKLPLSPMLQPWQSLTFQLKSNLLRQQ